MSSGDQEWQKVVDKFKAMKMNELDDFNIDISDIEKLIKKEKAQVKKSKGGKQKQTEALTQLNKTQLKEYDDLHGTNLLKCSLLITAGHVKRNNDGTLRLTGKRTDVEKTYRTNLNKKIPEHLKTEKVTFDIDELLSVQKVVELWGLKTGRGYSSNVKAVHVDPEKDVSDDDTGAAAPAPVSPADEPESSLAHSSFSVADTDVEAEDEQLRTVVDVLVDDTAIAETQAEFKRRTSPTENQPQHAKTEREIQLEKEIEKLQGKLQDMHDIAQQLAQRDSAGVNPSVTQGTETRTETPPAAAAAPAAAEPTADREAEAEQKLPEHLKHGSMTAAIDATLKAAGIEIKPSSLTPLDDIEAEKKQEVPSREQQKYGRHENIPWHGHNVPWEKIINNLDWHVYPKMPVYDYAGWSNYESVWGGTA